MWLGVVLVLVITLISFFLTNNRYRWFYIFAKTYRRDLRALIAFYKINKYTQKCLKEGLTMASVCSETANANPKKVAFYFENEIWTFEMVQDLSNKVARFFHNEGYRKGDCVALMLENCPEYPAIWLGLSQIGVRTALINTNLNNKPLMHSLNAVNTKAIIHGSNFSERVKILHDPLKTLKLYEYQNIPNAPTVQEPHINLKLKLESVPGEPLPQEYMVGRPRDPLVYVYTSGTTGLPKAAVMTNLKCLIMLRAMRILAQYRSDDIAYIPLPLYHLAGGLAGIGQILSTGATCVLAKKFSATNYFKDCDKYNVTVAQYIGEMCRYLLALPEGTPINHKLRIVTGNGLRPQLWNQFVDRFNIKQVIEIYAATEGISNMLNIDNTPGSIGFVPRYLRKYYPVTLIKCDEATGEPVRNKEGFCMECDVDEPGLAVGKINPKSGVTNFDGYTDKAANEKKILRNVLVAGDYYFNSGDVLVFDELGYFYFKDRTGDTFRWKGENVSTSEVEMVISGSVQLGDVVVFGVQIPETDGKAGMAAIVDPNGNIEMDTLAAKLKRQLASYAMPMFVRILNAVELTGTYKLKKVELQAEGFDVNKIKDTLYYYNMNLEKYVVLTKELYGEIMDGKVRM